MRRLFLAVLTVTFSLSSFAQSGANQSKILSFTTWKSQQITAADNRTIRVGNQITILKSQTTSNQNDINTLEVEFRVSQNAAQVVRDLTIEDYFNVYLSQFAGDPTNIQAAARSLTPAQVAALLKVYLNSRNAAESAPNQASNI